MPLSRRLAAFPRTRFVLRVTQVLVVVLALSIGGTGAFLVTQGSRTTEVSEDALLAEFRSNAQTAPSSETPEGGASEAAVADGPSEQETRSAPAQADQTAAETQPAGTDDAPDSPASPAPEASPSASAAATPPGDPTSEPEPEPVTATFGKADEGVYTYDTDGYETVSMAGGRHDYPEQTYASLRHTDGCGWETDHRFLEEHREVKQWCSDGVQLGSTGFSSYITFFGQQSETHGTCDPPQVVARHDAAPADSFTSTCSGDGWTSTATATYVAAEALTIGGTEVPSLHYTQVTTLEGSTRGRSDMEIWYHPETGLPLKMIRQTTTHAQAFGGEVEYNEDVTMVLASLTPRR